MSLKQSYMNVLVSDLLAKKIITKKQWKWLNGLRIPSNDIDGLWIKKNSIDVKIFKALKKGVVSELQPAKVAPSRAHYVISDDLGIKGVFNPATGKIHDSKSSYYKDVKAAGCVIVGNEAKAEAKPVEAKICEKELKRDIAQAIQQLGG